MIRARRATSGVRLKRRLYEFAGIILGAVLLYSVAVLGLGYLPLDRDFAPTPGGTEVFVCSNGVHTDFVLPVKTPVVDWTQVFPARDFSGPIAPFDHIGIGWGDLDFYRSTPHWRDFKLGTALRALGGFGSAAVHAQYRPGPQPDEDCGGLRVDQQQYRALADYIDGDLLHSPVGDGNEAVSAAPGYGGSDVFYWAYGRFSLLATCNAWIGRGLRAAGLPTGLWTPFAFLVMAHLR
jgi:uncharacterized protein (TIGR02117 family)